jgi:hypothetical protein
VLWSVVGIFMIIGIASAIASSEWIYLAIAFAPPSIYFFTMRPFVSLFGLYCFLVPFDSILVVSEQPHGATVTKLIGIASMSALFITGVFEKKIVKPDKIVIWWGFFVVFGVLSILWAIRPEMMYLRIPTALGLFLMYLTISSYKVEGKDFEIVKKMIIYGGVVASIYTTFLYFVEGIKYLGSERASLLAGEQRADPNQFAFALLIPFALTVNAAFTERKLPVRLLNWAFLGIIVFAIIITGSRGALLGTITILLTLLFNKGRKHLLVPAMIIFLIILRFLPEMLFDRISQSVETGGAGRLDIWNTGLEALKYYWLSGYSGLLGIGLDNFPAIFAKFGPFYSGELAPHNIYLCAVVELGIIGSSFMGIAIFKHYSLIANKFYRYDHNSAVLKAALFGLMISAFFLDVIWRKSFWLLWMLIMMHNTVRKTRSPL